jgi:DNA-binding IclR family transcriptional regulator
MRVQTHRAASVTKTGSQEHPPNVDGTQAIRRATSILKRIAQGNAQGVGLAEIVEAARLPRSTTHRILKCLVEEGLVDHNVGARRYLIGNLTHELGLSVSSGSLEIAMLRQSVESVARRTGVTAYLMKRSGVEAVCVQKAEGNSVVRVIPVEVGQRRFLGLGAGATALLAALDPDTSEFIIGSIAPMLRAHPGITPDLIREMVALTRKTGFAVSHGNVVKDVFGIGMSIPADNGRSSLAISIAAHAALADEGKIAAWKQVIKEEIQSAVKHRKA